MAPFKTKAAGIRTRQSDYHHLIASHALFSGKGRIWKDALGGLLVIGLSLGTMFLMRIALAH